VKKLSVVFAILAVLLSDVMCAVVAYSYCNMQWGIKYMGFSAPAGAAFLYAIPFCIGIAVCAALSLFFRSRAQRA